MGPVVEISGQKCASFGKKANKCVKAGCVFTRVNNAAFKTCTNPPVAVTAAPTAAPAPVCASFSKAKKCRKNAACDWAKAAGKKYKSCVAAVPDAAAVSICPSIRGRKCRENAGCDWIKIAGKTRKTCVAASDTTTSPAPVSDEYIFPDPCEDCAHGAFLETISINYFCFPEAGQGTKGVVLRTPNSYEANSNMCIFP